MAREGLGYEDIAGDLRQAILDGTYLPGMYLPTGKELADRYQVAVLTIRRALEVLAGEGLVTPSRGRGTRVRNPYPLRLPLTRHAQLNNNLGPFETAAAAQGRRGVTDTLDVTRVPADNFLATELGIPKGAPVVRRSTQMSIENQVIQVQYAFLPAELVDGTPLAEEAKLVGGTYPALRAAGHNLAQAVETVTGRMPSREETRSLKLTRGAPVLEVLRTTRTSDGTRIVHTRTIVNADHASLVYHQEL
jgi:GntR family transcriptional regulator